MKRRSAYWKQRRSGFQFLSYKASPPLKSSKPLRLEDQVCCMLILFLSTVLIGRDRLARMYMGIAGRAAEEFALSQRAAKMHGNGPSPDRDRIIGNALWGIFNAVTCGSLGVGAARHSPCI
jgi:hypothetical protein